MRNRVLFKDEGHVYTYNGEQLTSVSRLLDIFKPEYPREYFLDRGALKELIPDLPAQKKAWKESGKTIMSDEFIHYLLDQVDIEDFMREREILEKKWVDKNHKSIVKGNTYHLAREHESYKRGYEVNPYDGLPYQTAKKKRKLQGYDNYSLKENLYELPDGFYPELLVSILEYRTEKGEIINPMLCGQSDKVFIGTDELGRYIDIDDYKSNEKVSDWAGKDEDTGRINKMLPPISHIPASKWHGYELQMSAYAFMLEQVGYRVRNVGFTHINTLHHCEYRRREVGDMIEAFHKMKVLDEKKSLFF